MLAFSDDDFEQREFLRAGSPGGLFSELHRVSRLFFEENHDGKSRRHGGQTDVLIAKLCKNGNLFIVPER
jgi:hypothetical protein